jgi:hypothetical protein
MALYRLNRIAYPGEDFQAALVALKTSEDPELAQRAGAVLAKLQSV